MGHDDATQSSRDDWRVAEARYAEAFVRFLDEGPVMQDPKGSAVDLARLRYLADRARDRYFRKVLA